MFAVKLDETEKEEQFFIWPTHNRDAVGQLQTTLLQTVTLQYLAAIIFTVVPS